MTLSTNQRLNKVRAELAADSSKTVRDVCAKYKLPVSTLYRNGGRKPKGTRRVNTRMPRHIDLVPDSPITMSVPGPATVPAGYTVVLVPITALHHLFPGVQL